MTRLTLIRHGETDWNRARRIQGSTDIPLNDVGREQARIVGAALRTGNAAQPVTVVASDLSRARETAEIVSRELGAHAPILYEGLRERFYGEAEGLDSAEFFRRWGDWHVAEVPGAEPLDDLRRRALAALALAVRNHRAATGPGEASLVVVTHGALIRELLRHGSSGEFPPAGVRLPNGSAYDLLFERDRIRLLSDVGAIA